MTVTVLALLAGAVVGLALGALGGGGSVLAVPALIYLLGFTPVAATTASLVIVAVTSAMALSAHARDGHVQWRTGLLFAAAGVVPAMLGGLLAARLPGRVLTLAFAAVATAAAVRMLGVRRRRARGLPEEAGRPRGHAVLRRLRGRPEKPPRASNSVHPARASGSGDSARDPAPAYPAHASDSVHPARAATPVHPARASAAGAGLGVVTGVLGVGGGFLAVPALVGVLGLRMRAAVGTSLLVITVNSVAALALRAGTVQGLDWSRIAPFAGAALLGAWDGRRLAARFSGPGLQRAFGWVLLGVAGLMLLDGVV
ncbi:MULTISPECIES: TSUP family transporter [unclassified Streptomyces]|uniref:TSUP family transporter n=1 Tax=unclassified Streptomyces TaxID=2593676 RepID=UPI000DD81FBE|nr:MULTISPECIES: TSUP family transporter [unclassified Streptomyces]QZZ31014.1 sulfite exporter TauE/SafE family protein [Streptomyces sp. ST1015]